MSRLLNVLLSMSSFMVTTGFNYVDWQCPRRSSLSSRRYGKTQYTIDDDLCAPTDEAELKNIVHRHCRTLDLFLQNRPIAAHTRAAFQATKEQLELGSFRTSSQPRRIILDSGCGTGRSTILLGERFPDHTVIGVDRSFTRLSRNALSNEIEDSVESQRPFQALSSNVLLVRAELTDFWRCCLEDGWHVDQHYILYPNPYPKKNRIKKRFYAHPSFPLIISLGGDITVRSNWQGYLKEFAQSVVHASDNAHEADGVASMARPYLEDALRGPRERTDKSVSWTLFEKKYDDVGESTYELVLRNSDGAALVH